MIIDVDRQIVAKLLNYTTVEDMYDYRNSGQGIARRDNYLKIISEHRKTLEAEDNQAALLTNPIKF